MRTRILTHLAVAVFFGFLLYIITSNLFLALGLPFVWLLTEALLDVFQAWRRKAREERHGE